ncbi:hypothetical protein HG536_0G02400 [Torulaspora globosa]|uniref:Sm domain-containing protein n=1 Tax=Torulaspora globosa TaxID=48254 RepID=A0A7G3ZLJ3_9SACH|nr:uncharacterized protein HG536_0G02400 [Torulaspora globosa]QLL34379.1 hypothetical protein HG536_0G02400 [Torulaspora globosa]
MKLVYFLKKLRNEQVTVELKNGTTVWGTLQNVSPQMNATLTNVKLSLARSASSTAGSSALAGMYLSDSQLSLGSSSDGSVRPTASLQYINIRGNTIRQIILPDSLNLDALLVDEEQWRRLKRTDRITSESSKKRRADFVSNPVKRIRRGV